MNISLVDIGKKYNRKWIFKNIAFDIDSDEKIAITGHNGAGKSTLLQILGGYIAPTNGKVIYGKAPGKNDLQTSFSFAAPYLNLIEEFTLTEHLAFHAQFKKPVCDIEEMISRSGLTNAEHKYISEFSSGMKQRLRLALAFFYHSEIILLDEPGSNLDSQGMEWYLGLTHNFLLKRTLIIASNQQEEYKMCNKILKIEDYKN